MPLPHAILGFLEYQPLSGYDLKKYFDQSIAHFWSATLSHIYKALEGMEADGWVGFQLMTQEGRPNRKQYQITATGREELQRWAAKPMPVEIKREAWLIQVFFAHTSSNEEIANLFDQRIEGLRTHLVECQAAQAHIDEAYRQVGIERMRGLWQMTLDYGVDYYNNEITWLEKAKSRIQELPGMESEKE